MSITPLETPVLAGGIHNTYFFNGRLLAAEDLKTEQAADRRQRRQLGQAIGEGVVYGLEVSEPKGPLPEGTTSAVLTVTAGLAINRLGQALQLPETIDVELVRSLTRPPAGAGLFDQCREVTATEPPLTGAGVYVLLLSPASGFEGRAPASGLGENGATSPGCLSRFAVEGVQFRLIRLETNALPGISAATQTELNTLLTASAATPSAPAGTSAASAGLPAVSAAIPLSRLRNLLAHLCFGTEEKAGFPENPFLKLPEKEVSHYTSYGALDVLRNQNLLTECDVPLALLYWTSAGIRFVDKWAVRRRPVPPSAAPLWPLPLSARQTAEAEAVFFQFQDHLDDLLQKTTSASALAAIRLKDYFRYLPACGFVPVKVSDTGLGFRINGFFETLVMEVPGLLEGAKLAGMLHDSWLYPPIDTTTDTTSSGLLHLYFVRENAVAVGQRGSDQPYMVFVGREPGEITEML